MKLKIFVFWPMVALTLNFTIPDAALAYYDPGVQRWINRDPLPDTGFRLVRKTGASENTASGLHPYRFVANNPVNSVDGFGLFGIIPPGVRLAPPGAKAPCVCGETVEQITRIGPFDARRASELARAAQAEEAVRFPPGNDVNGPGDAFRHCFWTCRMAVALGEDTARTAGKVHEECNPGTAASSAMDQANNELGIELSRGDELCGDACEEAVRSGRARVLLP